jgi:hypothetical protein
MQAPCYIRGLKTALAVFTADGARIYAARKN